MTTHSPATDHMVIRLELLQASIATRGREPQTVADTTPFPKFLKSAVPQWIPSVTYTNAANR